MSKPNIRTLTCTALLAAMIVVLSLTPLGYVPIGIFKLALVVLPVAIGGAVLGPWAGLILGGVFGLTSFFTCFGMDALGSILLGIDPIRTFLMCIVPRLLCGVLPPLLCKVLPPKAGMPLWKQALSCGLTAAVNTVLFLGAMWLFFGREFIEQNPAIMRELNEVLKDANIEFIGSFSDLFWILAGFNALIEIALNLTVGTAISRALTAALRRMR